MLEIFLIYQRVTSPSVLVVPLFLLMGVPFVGCQTDKENNSISVDSTPSNDSEDGTSKDDITVDPGEGETDETTYRVDTDTCLDPKTDCSSDTENSPDSDDDQDWTRVHAGPPSGATVLETRPHEDVLYAVSPNKLWVREHNTPWRLAGRLQERSTFTVHPQLVALGSDLWFRSDRHSWRSTDGGSTWNELEQNTGCMTVHDDDLYAIDSEDTILWDKASLDSSSTV